MKYLISFFLVISLSTSAQSVINGSFENTTLPDSACYDNLSNATFNKKMLDVVAYGSASEIDVYWVNGCYYFGGTAYGNHFIVLDVNNTLPVKYDACNLKLDAALVQGEVYHLSLWYSGSDKGFTSSPLAIGVSASNNTQGTIVSTAPKPTNNWSYYCCSFTAPISGQYISITASGDANNRWTAVDNVELFYTLPVELLSFTGKSKNGKVYLDWETGSEYNNDFFVIDRMDGFTVRVKAVGNSTHRVNYEYIDQQPHELNYYTLRQFDYDGNNRSLRMISVYSGENKISTSTPFPYTILGQIK